VAGRRNTRDSIALHLCKHLYTRSPHVCSPHPGIPNRYSFTDVPRQIFLHTIFPPPACHVQLRLLLPASDRRLQAPSTVSVAVNDEPKDEETDDDKVGEDEVGRGTHESGDALKEVPEEHKNAVEKGENDVEYRLDDGKDALKEALESVENAFKEVGHDD